jgi:DNA-binding NarL/FixJ family response regulator
MVMTPGVMRDVRPEAPRARRIESRPEVQAARGTVVVLADDHLMVRQALRVLLEQAGVHVAGEASNGHEAIALCGRVHPDVAILDLAMPILNGMDAAREIRRDSPSTAVILLTAHEEESFVLEALRTGVTGYVLKTRAAEDLVQAIQDVARGGVYFNPTASRDAVRDSVGGAGGATESALTPRQRHVLQLVAEGKTTKEIASVLGVSVKTADSHRTSVMRKLGIHHTAGLVRWAVRNGLVQP